VPNEPGTDNHQLRPRAERFPIHTPLRYRESGQSDWNEGVTINISRSGVLFDAPEDAAPASMLELRIIFPREIAGQTQANVVCVGQVVRSQPPESPAYRRALAVAIRSYRFTREGSDMGAVST